MKTLTCDICDGTNLVMNDGVFVCQTCETKYSKEDAKRMMGIGTDGSSTQHPKTHPAQPMVTAPMSVRNGKYTERTLQCKDCGNYFVFTADEQEFYKERGFENEPQRCRSCRDARKADARKSSDYFTASCASCGQEAKIPFEPKVGKSVYCSDCFNIQSRRGKNLSTASLILGIGSIIMPSFLSQFTAAGVYMLFALVLAIIGLVLGINGKKKAKKCGASTKIAQAGIIISIIMIAQYVLILFIVLLSLIRNN